MISCTEFIPSYSLFFSWLDETAGHDKVLEYWKYISDNYLDMLENAVREKGIFGCWEYWKHSLNEEAADFVQELYLNEDGTGKFSIDMRYCPSKGRLLEYSHFTPYYDYCSHCPALYPPMLERYGLRGIADMDRVDEAACGETYYMDNPPAPEIAAAGWKAALEELATGEGITGSLTEK
ncbi:MAG: hypothetical protein GX900_07075 [Clostridiaceae bacterium]|nr:hypothetical protein [Clostridiaceae bacterium]